MPRTKKEDVRIKVAIIGGIAAVIAAYVGSPLVNTQWQERALVDLSLGESGIFPHSELQKDEVGYYVEIFANNRGKSDAKTNFVVQGTNTKVRFGEIGSFEYYQTVPFTIKPDTKLKTSKIYLLPDENSNIFSISFSTQQGESVPPFQELNVFRPTTLTFENQNGIYQLIEQR